jgi:alkylation response protein AidB-like acyl-CoA dehydrogenase
MPTDRGFDKKTGSRNATGDVMSVVEATKLFTEADLIARAQAISEMLREKGEAIERNRFVPHDIMKIIRDAGVVKVCQPAKFGGLEFSLSACYEVIKYLAQGCASTAWCTAIGATGNWVLASYSKEAQHDVWSKTHDSFTAGSIAPMTTARHVPGGVRFSGRWPFGSGVDHADWVKLGVMIPSESDASVVAPWFAMIPISDVSVDDDWHTYGLAGTGSKTIVCDDVFVPTHRLISFADTMNKSGSGLETHSNPMFRAPFLAVFPAMLAVVGVGAAQGAVKSFIDQVRVRETRGAVAGGKLRMASFGTIQLRIAEADAAASAADLVLSTSLQRVQDIVKAGRIMTKEERIVCRREQAYAVKLAAESAQLVNEALGGQGLSLHGHVQRCWRDATAVARHISMNWDTVGTMYGQMVLGLEPVGQY